uniref:phosphorylated adapter RNA export protein-like n=1 Tax=Myxine glutinosa TaxID=7769 RepID=UPI00358E99F3
MDMDAELLGDLEEGEVSDSDCDSATETDTALVPDRASMGLTPPQVSPPAQSLAASRYRSVVASYSSGEGSSGDSDEDDHENLWKKRRLEVLGKPHAPSPAVPAVWPSNVTSKSKKINNIWGGVLQIHQVDCNKASFPARSLAPLSQQFIAIFLETTSEGWRSLFAWNASPQIRTPRTPLIS